MDAQQAIAAATALLGPAAAPFLGDPLWSWEALLPEAVTIDSTGKLPSQPEYVPTYDAHWLAGQAAIQIDRWQAATPRTTKLSVDGDSIEKAAAQWSAVAAQLMARSPIAAIAAGGGGRLVPLEVYDFRPTSSIGG